MNATTAKYELDQVHAALEKAEQGLQRAALALDGELSNATRWAVCDIGITRDRLGRIREHLRPHLKGAA